MLDRGQSSYRNDKTALSEIRPIIVGVGLTCLDESLVVYPNPSLSDGQNQSGEVRTRHVDAGGMVANALACCARFGGRCHLVSAVGDDDVGAWLIESLNKKTIDCRQVLKIPNRVSPSATIVVDASTGERWIRPQTGLSELTTFDSKANIPADTKVILVDGFYPELAHYLISEAKARSIPIVGDLGLDSQTSVEMAKQCDYLIVNEVAAFRYSRARNLDQAIECLTELCPAFVGITLGRRGVVVSWSGERSHIPSPSVSTIDSTGAGDAFHGAFAFGIGCGLPIQHTLWFSVTTAALNTQKIGAQAGLPSLDEVYGTVQNFFPSWLEHE